MVCAVVISFKNLLLYSGAYYMVFFFFLIIFCDSDF